MKRFFKIFSFALLGLAAAGLGLALFIRYQYPPERVKQVLLATLSQRYGVTATCEGLAFGLFSGFVLEKIELVQVKGQNALTPADFLSPLSIEKIAFSYRWRSLLARRLEIDEVTISRPSLRYWQAPDSSTNLDAWLAAFTDSASSTAVNAEAELPISVHLKSFRLQDLGLRATLVSGVDTQKVACDHLDLEVSELEVDRRSHYRAQFKTSAGSAPLTYLAQSIAPAEMRRFDGVLSLQGEGNLDSDSLGIRFDISLQNGQWVLNGQKIALPAFRTAGELQYDFNSGSLKAPVLQLQLARVADLTGSFAMGSTRDTAAFEIHLPRGKIDLDGLTELLHAHRHLPLLAEWQSWRAAGTLDIVDGYLRQNQAGWQYRGALKGENIEVADSVSQFALSGTNLDLTWQTAPADSSRGNADSDGPSTGLQCQLGFSTCILPLDSQTVMATGPAQLRANLSFIANDLPYRGDLELNWRDFSGANLHGRASFATKKTKPHLPDELKTSLQIELDSLELAPLTANGMSGRIKRADIKIEGERLEALRLTGSLQNDTLVYFTEESFGKIPPYHLQLSSRIKTDTAFSHLTFSEGTLRCPPAQATFQGTYDVKSIKLRLDLPQVQVALFEIMQLLPQDIVADTTFPFISGTAQAQGWFESRLTSSGELEYDGKFFARMNDGVYADTLSGIYAENVEAQSAWTLSTDSTSGDYRATVPVLRVDYLHVPPAYTNGKMFVFEDRFLIQAGELEIPAWSIDGTYSVLGKFLPKGLQMTTTIAAGMKAPEEVVLGKSLLVQGELNTRFVLDQYLPDDITASQPARITGSLDVMHFNLALDSLLAMRDLNVRANFTQEFDLLDLSLPPATASRPLASTNANEALLLYEASAPALREDQSAPSHLSLKELRFGNYRFEDIEADLMLGKGRLDVTEFRMNLFNGNLIGNLLIGLGDGNLDSLSYSMSAQISSIDVSHLRRLGVQERGSKLSADFALSGVGAASEKMEEALASLGGALNISKIESKAASNLLQALDPKGTEVGVQRMRLLLKTGWNVKTMKFEIKNGFVNVSVSLIKTKLWTALFNLPPQLDFARFPLRYFMQAEEAN
ncbi:MAG: hypothetical protein ACREOO_07195 [bacterium]